jgi:hypothetical protein
MSKPNAGPSQLHYELNHLYERCTAAVRALAAGASNRHKTLVAVAAVQKILLTELRTHHNCSIVIFESIP